MKAVVRSAGSMLLKDGISQPSSCGAKEVLVDVKAAGINPVDYKVIRFFPELYQNHILISLVARLAHWNNNCRI